MISMVRSVIICFLTVFILSLTINGKPIFHFVYSVISPLTISVQDGAHTLVSSIFNSTQDYSRKIFNNSLPKVKDAVKSRAAAPRRHSKDEPSEEILVEEKEELDDLIKSHY